MRSRERPCALLKDTPWAAAVRRVCALVLPVELAPPRAGADGKLQKTPYLHYTYTHTVTLLILILVLALALVLQ